MKKIAIIISLILAITVINHNLAQAEELPFTIDASEYITYIEAEEKIYAEGDVKIVYGNDSLRADKIEIDLKAEIFTATGNVILIDDGQEIKGQAVEYDYKRQSGKLIEGEGEIENLLFRGAEINFKEQDLIITDSYLTPCKQERAYYALQAESLKVYPNDRLEAEGVWLLVFDNKVLPLPNYVATLDGTRIDQEISSIPIPRIGYNRDDGFYGSIEYNHYINPNLTGEVFVKGTSRKRSGFDLDYTYQPSEEFKLGTGLGYYQHLGWQGRLRLNNQLGRLDSDLAYTHYYEDDEDSDDYQESKWDADWDLKTHLAGVDLKASYEDSDEQERFSQLYTARYELGDYYSELKYSQDRDFDYSPELEIGMDNFDLGSGNYLSSAYSIGQLNFNNQELKRERFRLKFDNQSYNLTDRTDLSWLINFNDINYDREDNYRSYQLGLGLDRRFFADTKLSLKYNLFDEFGQAVIKEDGLIKERSGPNDLIGRRHYLVTDLSQNYQLSDSLELKSNLTAGYNHYHKTDYYYGKTDLRAEYKLDKLRSLQLDYKYLIDGGSPPDILVDNEQKKRKNELSLGYSQQTSKDYRWWRFNVEAGYDFKENKLNKVNYSARREVDCLAAQLSVEHLKRSVDFELEFKF